jgi:hypothetical protein
VTGAGTARRYRMYGLEWESEVPLAALRGNASRPADVFLTHGPRRDVDAAEPPGTVVARLDMGDASWWIMTRDGGTIRVRYPRLAEVACMPAGAAWHCSLHLTPVADAGWASVLAASSIPASLLVAQGRCPLHASAVVVEGRAFAFMGRTGQGKTTLAALLCAAGATVLTDDLLIPALMEPVQALAGSISLRLRPGPVDWRSALQGDFSDSVDGRTVFTPLQSPPPAVPLAALVVPVMAPGTPELSGRRLSGAEAFLALAGAPRVVGWVDESLKRAALAELSELARRVPVIEFRMPPLTGHPDLPAKIRHYLRGLVD